MFAQIRQDLKRTTVEDMSIFRGVWDMRVILTSGARLQNGKNLHQFTGLDWLTGQPPINYNPIAKEQQENATKPQLYSYYCKSQRNHNWTVTTKLLQYSVNSGWYIECSTCNFTKEHYCNQAFSQGPERGRPILVNDTSTVRGGGGGFEKKFLWKTFEVYVTSCQYLF